jgi:hypothetical protein
LRTGRFFSTASPRRSGLRNREELLPTFKRLKEKHPDAVMQMVRAGQVVVVSEEARAETARRAEAADAAARGRNWRPGGSHKDPRQPYKDAKKQRNQDRRQRRFEYRTKDDQAGGTNKDQGPKREWNKAVAPESRERMPWTERAKPAGRWPRDERPDRPGPKTGGWGKPPARGQDHRPAEARPAQEGLERITGRGTARVQAVERSAQTGRTLATR